MSCNRPKLKPGILLFIMLVSTMMLSVSCVSPRMVRPLEKGQKAIRVDVGHVMEESNATVVESNFMLAITYAKGINKKTSGYFTLRANYILPVLEGGFIHAFAKPDDLIPGFSASLTGGLMPIFARTFVVLPTVQTAGNIYWEFSPKNNLIYVGTSFWLWPGSGIKYVPHIGSSISFGNYEFNLEAKHIPQNTDLRFNNPAAGFFLGLTKKF